MQCNFATLSELLNQMIKININCNVSYNHLPHYSLET